MANTNDERVARLRSEIQELLNAEQQVGTSMRLTPVTIGLLDHLTQQRTEKQNRLLQILHEEHSTAVLRTTLATTPAAHFVDLTESPPKLGIGERRVHTIMTRQQTAEVPTTVQRVSDDDNGDAADESATDSREDDDDYADSNIPGNPASNANSQLPALRDRSSTTDYLQLGKYVVNGKYTTLVKLLDQTDWTELRCYRCKGNAHKRHHGHLEHFKGVTGFRQHIQAVHNTRYRVDQILELCGVKTWTDEELATIGGKASIEKVQAESIA